MLSHFVPLIAAMSSTQQVALAIVGMGVGFLTLVSLAGIIIPGWVSVCKLRMETALKQQMVERGMSADEIVAVLSGPVPSTNTIDLPCASEVVVESEGEWSPALILKRADDRYFVHYVGHDLSDNEWVSGARVRFPESARREEGSPWDGIVPRRRSGGLLVRQGRPFQAGTRRSGDLIANPPDRLIRAIRSAGRAVAPVGGSRARGRHRGWGHIGRWLAGRIREPRGPAPR